MEETETPFREPNGVVPGNGNVFTTPYFICNLQMGPNKLECL
jgi:hypothetical protein